MGKERLDIVLVEKNLFTSREKARKNIMAGLIFVDNKRVDKPGEMINIDSRIEVKGTALPYVSRGGLKLEKALKEFKIDVNEKTALDVGASTGGFTDCFLKNGAAKVIAVDVGYGQFAWELRNDTRVKLMERTNIRYVTSENIGTQCDICAIDVSFISLRLVLPVVNKLIKDDGEVICLIKPQFEAGKEKVGKKGVIRDPEIHKEVINSIVDFSVQELKFSIMGLSYSPIKGPEGNIEYLLYLKKNCSTPNICDLESLITFVVEESHKTVD